MAALLETHCPDLHLVARGKVRDIYSVPERDDALLFVATDRVSAFDVVMNNGIPKKGQLLTQLSAFWFEKLKDIIPNHLITCDLTQMPESVQRYSDQLQGRSMLVKKCEVIKVEAIVRGYLTGSPMNEYKQKGTIHGIKLPPNLPESAKLAEPLFTPSTKADVGSKDENIHPDQVKDILPDPSLADSLTQAALQLFKTASEHAAKAGLILADTKFEFGLLRTPGSSQPQLILIDEALTPDSSRFWPQDQYAEGKKMTGIDKQYLREWLQENDFMKTQQAVDIPEEIIQKTFQRYIEAFKLLTGRDFMAM